MSVFRLAAILFWSASLFVGVPSAAQETAPTDGAPSPPSVSVVSAVTRELISTVTVTGTLVPRETVVIGADVDGLRIEALLADEGDLVDEGAVLAKLATDMIEIELARNESEIARTEAALAQAGSQIAEAEAAVVEADAALARSGPLRKKGIVGQDVLDQRVAAAAAAKARLASARQGVAVAQADEALARAARRELELRRSKAEIRAPTAGLVLSRAARLGSIVSAGGGGLFEIARDGLIELDAEVSETVLGSLAKGQTASVSVSGAKAIAGSVRLVAPEVDQTTRLGHVYIALEPSPALRAGTFARGEVEIGRSRGVVIPRTAVVIDQDRSIVQVVRDGVIESRDVTLGITSGDEVEVTEGLKDGDAVTPMPIETAEARR